jgi:hypothetical protein
MKTTNKRMDGAQFVIVKSSWMVLVWMMARGGKEPHPDWLE